MNGVMKPPTTDALSAWVSSVICQGADIQQKYAIGGEEARLEDYLDDIDTATAQLTRELLDKLLVPALDAAIRETMNRANANSDLLRGVLIAMTVQKLREMVIT